MASKHPAEQWAEHRRQREGEEQQQRAMVIAPSSTPEIPKRPCTPSPTRS